jgi:ABC-type transport system involved in multi-copper enzyme maturation permease subunit
LNSILIPAHHISGEAESGTLELLLSYPIRRTRLLLSLWLCSSFLLLLIVSGTWAGSLIAISLFHNLTPKLLIRMLQIGTNLWLFSIFVATFTLLLSTFGKEGSRTGIISAGVTLVCYFLHYLSKLWDAIAFLKPFNMFTYYQPQMLMFGHESFSVHVIVLVTLTGVCLALSILQFGRRDIPG